MKHDPLFILLHSQQPTLPSWATYQKLVDNVTDHLSTYNAQQLFADSFSIENTSSPAFISFFSHYKDLLAIHNTFPSSFKLLGTPFESLHIIAQRHKFLELLKSQKILTPKNHLISHYEDYLRILKKPHYPLILRKTIDPDFIVKIKSEAELLYFLDKKETKSYFILEECLEKCQEIDVVLLRDSQGSCLIPSIIEHLDPLGISYNDSYCVTPPQTLSFKINQKIKTLAHQIGHLLKIVGGCSIKLAFDDKTSQLYVINVSCFYKPHLLFACTSSGYPLFLVISSLIIGKSFNEIEVCASNYKTAYYIPQMPHIAVKAPVWNLDRFPLPDDTLGISSKSIKEIISIGSTFAQALQKSIQSSYNNICCFSNHPYVFSEIKKEIKHPTTKRLFALYEGLKRGFSPKQINKLCYIHLFFICEIEQLIQLENNLKKTELDRDLLKNLKINGFSNEVIAQKSHHNLYEIESKLIEWKISPYCCFLDTVNYQKYCYISYQNTYIASHFLDPNFIVLKENTLLDYQQDRNFITFIKELEQRSSTLIFSNDLSLIVHNHHFLESPHEEIINFILSIKKDAHPIFLFASQIENTLSYYHKKSPHSHLTSSYRFIKSHYELINKLPLKTTKKISWKEVTQLEDAYNASKEFKFPVTLIPSYIIRGHSKFLAYSEEELKHFLDTTTILSTDFPTLIIESFVDKRQFEVACIVDNGHLMTYFQTEIIEEDFLLETSTIITPPQNISCATMKLLKETTASIVQALRLKGPVSCRYVIDNNTTTLLKIEMTPSKSYELIDRLYQINYLSLLADFFLGTLKTRTTPIYLEHVALKTPLDSYLQLKPEDSLSKHYLLKIVENHAVSHDMSQGFKKAWEQNLSLSRKKNLFISLCAFSKEQLTPYLNCLSPTKWEIFATPGTHQFLKEMGITSTQIFHATSLQKPNAIDCLKQQQIDLVVNVSNKKTKSVSLIKTTAIEEHIPIIDHLLKAELFFQSFAE